jgi:hypothetical protein
MKSQICSRSIMIHHNWNLFRWSTTRTCENKCCWFYNNNLHIYIYIYIVFPFVVSLCLLVLHLVPVYMNVGALALSIGVAMRARAPMHIVRSTLTIQTKMMVLVFNFRERFVLTCFQMTIDVCNWNWIGEQWTNKNNCKNKNKNRTKKKN